MFYLSDFGSIALPSSMARSDAGSFGTFNTGMTVAGGYTYDTYGDGIAPSAPTSFTHRFMAADSNRDDLETLYASWLSKRGALDKLYRTWPASGKSEWINARLMEVKYISNPHTPNVIDGIEMKFNSRSPHWNGVFHEEFLEKDRTDSTVVTLDNDGNISVAGVTIHIKRIRNDPTYCHAFDLVEVDKLIDGSYVRLFTYNPTDTANWIDEDDTLHIDLLTWTVTLEKSGGSILNVYADFELGAANLYENWLVLDAGSNTLKINPTIAPPRLYLAPDLGQYELTITYYDGYA